VRGNSDCRAALLNHELSHFKLQTKPHRVSTQNQSHNNADLYLSINNRLTPKMVSATIKTSPGQCNNGTPKKKINHKPMQMTGIFQPSVIHSLIAATQKMPSAMVPNGIMSTCCQCGQTIELTHAELMTCTAKAELSAPSGVVCSDLVRRYVL